MPISKNKTQEIRAAGRATWKEVAELAGVSQSAVSRTFTPGASVSEKTRQRVESAAAILGYRPHLLPRILRGGESSIVALVVGGLYNPYFATTLEVLMERLAEAGKQVMVVKAQSDSSLDELVDDFSRYQVDAVVSALSVASQKTADALGAYRIPIVTLNSRFAGGWIRSVSSDNRGAARIAHDLLAQRGCRQMAYFSGGGSAPDTSRRQGFVAAGKKSGLPTEVVIGGYDYDTGRKAARERFSQGSPPDGIFCVNDLVACGVIDALRYDMGRQVPDDVAVVGYDDIAMAAWAPYLVTTFDQDVAALADGVIELIKPDVSVAAIRVAPRLIVRATA